MSKRYNDLSERALVRFFDTQIYKNRINEYRVFY